MKKILLNTQVIQQMPHNLTKVEMKLTVILKDSVDHLTFIENINVFKHFLFLIKLVKKNHTTSPNIPPGAVGIPHCVMCHVIHSQ